MDNKQNIYRILDANINRAREGLRVLEDVARFILNDRKTTARLRSCRHLLDQSAREIYPQLLSARDSGDDLGRTFKEPKRKDLLGLTAANFKRVEEAVRVLEEFAKLFGARQGSRFKKIRFTMYQVEKKLIQGIGIT
ncbi:MAG: thiamine-phosphate pyrophosphorylase [bacterium]|nr:thiamine-phosphate pyrophosphorylase [bacterium]MDD5354192.1 thiamine-phosphate pyrophosphorylase [bacterium]MDD5756326.1 thiamine-phosphate pyrophosphorylase [bacterium]